MSDRETFYRKISESLDFNDSEVIELGKDVYQLINDAKACFLAHENDRCLVLCDIALDIIWEHLNTGHWKEVGFIWRKGYNTVSYIKAMAQFKEFELNLNVKELKNHSDVMKDIIKTCDMGLLMGYSKPDDLLSALATYVHTNFVQKVLVDPESETSFEAYSEPPTKRIKVSPPIDNIQGIEILHKPSLEYFQKHFYSCRRPVILKGCMDDWPALGKWSISYLHRVAGWRVVPVEVGSKYTDDSWSQKLMTVEEFIKQYLMTVKKDTGYLAQHQLFDQISDLQGDVIVPDYCAFSEEGDIEMNAWFGPKNTISPLHRDEKHNIFCQVLGEKYFKLFDPIYTDKLYVYENHLLTTTSQVDVEHPNLELFPEFSQIPFAEFTLSAGDMLFIPSQYWHYVRSLTTSFSVSFWWTVDKNEIN